MTLSIALNSAVRVQCACAQPTLLAHKRAVRCCRYAFHIISVRACLQSATVHASAICMSYLLIKHLILGCLPCHLMTTHSLRTS
jgi:hypothetical protein